MIKGKYVARVTVNFDYDETSEQCSTLLPFDALVRILRSGEFTEEIKRVLTDEIAEPDQGITVDVEQEFVDIWAEYPASEVVPVSFPACARIGDSEMETIKRELGIVSPSDIWAGGANSEQIH